MLVAERPMVEWVNRVRAEYLEMPGLRLTKPQMRKLWLLAPSLCDAIVDALVDSGFLSLRANNGYARVANDV
jgi:hypothetical protein